MRSNNPFTFPIQGVFSNLINELYKLLNKTIDELILFLVRVFVIESYMLQVNIFGDLCLEFLQMRGQESSSGGWLASIRSKTSVKLLLKSILMQSQKLGYDLQGWVPGAARDMQRRSTIEHGNASKDAGTV